MATGIPALVGIASQLAGPIIRKVGGFFGFGAPPPDVVAQAIAANVAARAGTVSQVPRAPGVYGKGGIPGFRSIAPYYNAIVAPPAPDIPENAAPFTTAALHALPIVNAPEPFAGVEALPSDIFQPSSFISSAPSGEATSVLSLGPFEGL